jgi:hypothetical protein
VVVVVVAVRVDCCCCNDCCIPVAAMIVVVPMGVDHHGVVCDCICNCDCNWDGWVVGGCSRNRLRHWKDTDLAIDMVVIVVVVVLVVERPIVVVEVVVVRKGGEDGRTTPAKPCTLLGMVRVVVPRNSRGPHPHPHRHSNAVPVTGGIPNTSSCSNSSSCRRRDPDDTGTRTNTRGCCCRDGVMVEARLVVDSTNVFQRMNVCGSRMRKNERKWDVFV